MAAATGGHLFGYRSRPGTEGAEWVVFEPEAAIVRRIFNMYADGLSLKAIVVKLNAERLAFPAKATRRGPERLGWAVSTIHTILANAKYEGRWVWNKTMFLKDPETGKRTPVARPKDDWVVEERPDLAIIDGELWARVQARLQAVREAYGATTQQKRPRGQAPEVYSPHLFSGLMRCAICGARITIQSSQRKKNGTVRSRSTSRSCGSPRPQTSVIGWSGLPGRQKSTASSAARRPCVYNWLRGLDLNHRPLGYESDAPGLPFCVPCQERALECSRVIPSWAQF